MNSTCLMGFINTQYVNRPVFVNKNTQQGTFNETAGFKADRL